MSHKKVTPVSRDELERRVNSALANEGQALRKTRLDDSSERRSRYSYYVVQTPYGREVDQDIDLEQLARKLGVLRLGEYLPTE